MHIIQINKMDLQQSNQCQDLNSNVRHLDTSVSVTETVKSSIYMFKMDLGTSFTTSYF